MSETSGTDKDPAEPTATSLVPIPGEELRLRYDTVVLEVLTGEDAGKRFELSAPRMDDEGNEFDLGRTRIVVGRAKHNDVVLTDHTVSMTHFELELGDDYVTLTDRQSRNGTWLTHRGRLLGPIALFDGAEFRAGPRCEFRLLCRSRVGVPASLHSEFANLRGGRSVAMRKLFSTIARVAPKNIKVLVHGETGTGKEEVAKALHQASGRRGPFIVLDCAALPRDLGEATILGHRKGAFTGATADQPGCFEAANGGTLFIDEIGELPLELQPKLLRVLQTRTVQRLGEHQPRPFDVRIISATHRDMNQEIASDRFRFDLYARLAQYVLEIPPLRERPEDIPPLAQYFVHAVAAEERREIAITDDAMEWLQSLHWRGNVRQLQNAVECAAQLVVGSVITRDDLVVEDRPRQDALPTDDALRHLSLQEGADRLKDAFLRRGCERALASTGGNIKAAAQLTGYGERGFRQLLERLGLRGREGGGRE